MQQACDEYLDAAEAEYESADPLNITYAGWRGDIALDGAVQSITWELSLEEGPTMSVSRNGEWGNPYTVPYKRRRQLEKLAALQKKPDLPSASMRNMILDGGKP